MDISELMLRKEIARENAEFSSSEIPAAMVPLISTLAAAPAPICAPTIVTRPSILPRNVAWAAGEQPVEIPIDPPPSGYAPLPQAEWLVLVWTREEQRGLARVFTPTNPPGAANEYDKWYDYRKDFGNYAGDLRSRADDPHPAIRANRLGQYFMVRIGGKNVLLFKSDLHLNQDGPRAYREGRPLPLVRMTQQIINEVRPAYFISTGTAGGVQQTHNLGDTVVSCSGMFHCGDPADFRNADFNCKTFGIPYWVKDMMFARAQALMAPVNEYQMDMPHPRYPAAAPVTLPSVPPRIHVCPDLPIITTDFFEFGNTTNGLDKLGCAVEMDDALLALAIEQMPESVRPKYAFLRNVSDPVINGNLDSTLQVMWAVYYYRTFGLLTSFNGALATWAVIAGN